MDIVNNEKSSSPQPDPTVHVGEEAVKEFLAAEAAKEGAGGFEDGGDEAPAEESADHEYAEILAQAAKRFRTAANALTECHELALDDLNFVNGEQWDETTKAQREADGRPTLTINKLSVFIDQLVGEWRKNRPGIKVRPVDDVADPQIAEIYDGLIRNIASVSGDAAADHAFEQSLGGGMGFFRVLMDYCDDDTFDQHIIIKRIDNQFSVYPDPESVEPDKRDARYWFITGTMSREDFEARWPAAHFSGWSGAQSVGELWEGWFLNDGKIRVAEYWVKEPITKRLVLIGNVAQMQGGQWVNLDNTPIPPDIQPFVATAIRGETITETEENKWLIDAIRAVGGVKSERIVQGHTVRCYHLTASQILEVREWPGKYIPIIPMFGKEVNIQGRKNWKSLIRGAKDAQQMYNYWRSKATEIFALAPIAPFLLTPEMVEGFEADWKKANRVPLPFLKYNAQNGMKPHREDPITTQPGLLAETQTLDHEIMATVGMFEASLGRKSNETSGVAIQRRNDEASNSTYVFFDNAHRAIEHLGRILIDIIPHVYDTARVIRTLGVDGTHQLAPINHEIINPVTGQTTIINDLSAGKYDLTVTTGPSYNSRRFEAVDSMLQFMQIYPAAAPLLGDMLARFSDWPEHDEVADRLKALLPPALQGQPPPPDPRVGIEQEKLALEHERNQILKTKTAAEVVSKAHDMKHKDIAAIMAVSRAGALNADQNLPAGTPGQSSI